MNTANTHYEINAFGLMADPAIRPRLRLLACALVQTGHALASPKVPAPAAGGGGDGGGGGGGGPTVAAWSGDVLPPLAVGAPNKWPVLQESFLKSPDATSITVPSPSAAKVSCMRCVFLNL